MGEITIQKEIIDYLEYRNITVLRVNSGAIKKGSYYIHLCKKGTSDIVGIYPGGIFWAIEVKKPGEERTEDQIIFQNDVVKKGGIATVAESVNDVIAVLDEKLTEKNYVQ